MNAVYKTHLLSLSYSRRLAGARMKRELAKLDRPNCFEPSSTPSTLAALSRLTPNVCHARNVHQLVIEDKCDVSANEIRRIVRSRLSGFKEGYSCIAVNCPACSHSSSRESSSDLGKLYINLRTGYCFCTQCFLQGPWSSLEVFLKALETSNSKSEKASCVPDITQYLSQYTTATAETNEMRRLWNSAQPVHSLSEETLVPFLDKLRLGDVSTDTLEKVGAKINLNLEQLILPCLTSKDAKCHSIKIISPNYKKSDAVQQQPETLEGDTEAAHNDIEEKSFPQQHPWLLGYHLARNKEEVILTSSAADTLTALDCLAVPALCLPFGISHLPLATMAFLEPFRKITLWLDNGNRGSESARAFARKLGEKRCHFIRSSEDTPSILQSRLKGKNVAQVLKAALPLTHKAVTTFSSLRKDVYAEIVQSQTIAGVRWRRFPALNDLLKGHRRGELTVFTGPTGAGKTTFLSEYSLDLCQQNVRTLWGSFEIRNVRLAKMMLQQFSGLVLESDPQMFDIVADEFEKLPMYFLAFHGQQKFTTVLEAMSHAVYVQDISHIVIDNLQFMMGSSGDSMDRFHQQDLIIGAFRRFATDNNVHITLVIHPRKEVDELSTSSIFGGAKASQEADNILILQDKRTHDPTYRRKYLEVAKNRYTGDLGVMPLEFHKESLSFAPRKRPKPVKKTAAPSPPNAAAAATAMSAVAPCSSSMAVTYSSSLSALQSGPEGT